ncbi:hypothetical protein Tco_0673978 [Tanacetum coccineum]
MDVPVSPPINKNEQCGNIYAKQVPCHCKALDPCSLLAKVVATSSPASNAMGIFRGGVSKWFCSGGGFSGDSGGSGGYVFEEEEEKGVEDQIYVAKIVQTRHGGGDPGALLPRSIRLEVPKFNGTEPESWIFAIQEYFDLLEKTDDQRLKVSVRNRFGPSKYEDPQGSLSKLLQTRTVLSQHYSVNYDDNPCREIPADPAYYHEDKVNFEGEGNVMTNDKGGGRTKMVSVAPAWHKDFVMH